MGLRVLILVLKYGLNIGAATVSSPWISARGVACRPYLFETSRQATQKSNLDKKHFYILVYPPREQFFPMLCRGSKWIWQVSNLMQIY